MNALVPLSMFGWFPVVLLLFWWLPARTAVITALILGWLFLPVAVYRTYGLPNFDKIFIATVGSLMGVVIFDFGRLLSWRPTWIDLPMGIWCLCPMATSLSNDLGLWDGFSESLHQTISWGIPYLLGRMYFTDCQSLRELAVGILIGGLIYVPLCWYEIRMSPDLHKLVYGFAPRQFEGMRFGGWRPRVFLEHGLALGIWMSASSLVGMWLWVRGTITRLGRLRMAWLIAILLITTILCKSAAALGLLLFAAAALSATRWPCTTILLFVLIVLPPGYVAVRATGIWDGSHAVALAKMISEPRAQSLEWRFRNEDILAMKALERPAFGWGSWGRSRVYDERGKDVAKTDGLWIIALGKHGLVGLSALGAALLVAPTILWLRLPAEQWSSRSFAPLAGLIASVLIVTNDYLLNGMINPIFIMCVGGLSSMCAGPCRNIAGETPIGLRKKGSGRVTRRFWPPPPDGGDPGSRLPPGATNVTSSDSVT